MLVDNADTEMGCFDDYLDAAPRAKTMRGFLLHVDQCITFCKTKFVTAPIINEASLKPFYSRLDSKDMKDFSISPNFEEARKQFRYESGKSRALQKQTIGSQCNLTIPWRVTILHDNWIELNENRDKFKILNDVPPSDDSFPYE